MTHKNIINTQKEFEIECLLKRLKKLSNHTKNAKHDNTAKIALAKTNSQIKRIRKYLLNLSQKRDRKNLLYQK